MISDLLTRSATELIQLYRTRRVSPVEVVAPPEENTSSEWKFDVTGYLERFGA